MPAAYRAAAGDGTSNDLILLGLVERFGALAVLGHGTLYSYEIRRMMLAEKVRTAYNSRASAMNFVEWAGSNPQLASLLAQAEAMAQDTTDG